MEIDVVTWYPSDKKTVLLQIIVKGDKTATERYKSQYEVGLSHLMKDTLLNELKTNKNTKDINVLCQNNKIDPYIIKLVDSKMSLTFEIKIRGVLMGVDTGNDTVINLIEILEMLETLKHTEYKNAW